MRGKGQSKWRANTNENSMRHELVKACFWRHKSVLRIAQGYFPMNNKPWWEDTWANGQKHQGNYQMKKSCRKSLMDSEGHSAIWDLLGQTWIHVNWSIMLRKVYNKKHIGWSSTTHAWFQKICHSKTQSKSLYFLRDVWGQELCRRMDPWCVLRGMEKMQWKKATQINTLDCLWRTCWCNLDWES